MGNILAVLFLLGLLVYGLWEDTWRIYLTWRGRAEYKVVRVRTRTFTESIRIRDRMEAEGWRSLYPSGAAMHFWRPRRE